MKFLKRVISVLLSVPILLCTACVSVDKNEVLSDPLFANGFTIGAQAQDGSASGAFDYNGTAKDVPSWNIAQWGIMDSSRLGYDKTQHDLRLNSATKEKSVYTLATLSGSKEVRVTPNKGIIELNINSMKEYGDIPKMNFEDWPHLLIEQPISEMIYLSESEFINVEMDLEMTKYYKHVNNVNSSTAQFQWIFTLQNMNPSAGSGVYRDYMWFNITIFDDRYDFAPGLGMVDGGKADATSKYIYAPKGEYFLTEPVTFGKKIKINKDFLPEMKKAFETAQEAGALKNSKFEDMVLGSTNIGWEVPGLYDIGIKISKMSLTAKSLSDN